MIKKQGSQYCVFSKDGSKNLGCFPSREQAVKRLQQIEYFKHAKSKREVAMKNVTNPVKPSPDKVPGIPVPNLDNTAKKQAVYAALAALTPIQRKSYANALVDRLKDQQGKIKEAMKLADKLMSDGLSGEEFDSLYEFTQSDVLFQLLDKAKANSNRVQVMAMVAKKARKAN
jgi:hypothetical protein